MNFAQVKSLKIPEGEVTKIVVGGVVLWEKPASYKNWVKYSTEADGVTIYNGGLGYKDGCRVRSGGAEASSDTASCTGFIPFVKGDKLYIYPQFTGCNIQNAINFYNSARENLGQVTDSGAAYGICSNNPDSFKTTLGDGVSILDLSDNTVSGVEQTAFVRITNNIGEVSHIITSGSEMIVTVNEEIAL